MKYFYSDFKMCFAKHSERQKGILRTSYSTAIMLLIEMTYLMSWSATALDKSYSYYSLLKLTPKMVNGTTKAKKLLFLP